MAAKPNNPDANYRAQPGDWAWQSWYGCNADRDAEANANDLRPNPNAQPCQQCGSDFFWQDATDVVWCIQCADPPSLAMVQAIWQVVVRDGERGAINVTSPCLEIWREMKNSHRSKNNQKPRLPTSLPYC